MKFINGKQMHPFEMNSCVNTWVYESIWRKTEINAQTE